MLGQEYFTIQVPEVSAMISSDSEFENWVWVNLPIERVNELQSTFIAVVTKMIVSIKKEIKHALIG